MVLCIHPVFSIYKYLLFYIAFTRRINIHTYIYLQSAEEGLYRGLARVTWPCLLDGNKTKTSIWLLSVASRIIRFRFVWLLKMVISYCSAGCTYSIDNEMDLQLYSTVFKRSGTSRNVDIIYWQDCLVSSPEAISLVFHCLRTALRWWWVIMCRYQFF